MTTQPTTALSDTELDRLDVLLDRCTDPETGLGNLEMLDGFLSALAVGPVDVELPTVFPAIWGTGDVPRRDERQTREAEALITRLAAGALASATPSAAERSRRMPKTFSQAIRYSGTSENVSTNTAIATPTSLNRPAELDFAAVMRSAPRGR